MSAESHAAPREDLNHIIVRAKKQLEHMIDLSPQVMLLVDRNRLVVRTNRALLDLLGLASFAGVLARPLESVFFTREKETEGQIFFLELLRASPPCAAREHAVVTAGNVTRQLRFTPVRSDNESDFCVLMVHDSTREQEAGRHLEKEHKRDAVKALMGALQHRLAQPLTVIMIRAHMISLSLGKSGNPVEEMKTSLREIMDLTMQIAEVLRSLEDPRDFVTQPYAAGIDILDIAQSSATPDAETGRHPDFMLRPWESSSAMLFETLLSILDTHEPGTALHARRTAANAALLAARCGRDPKAQATIQRAALLHDIGKLGVPDRILQKSDPLTPDELHCLRRHPETGFQLLSHFPLLAQEAETAFCHHEWYDGSGYPRGLAGASIPETARLVALVDAFDALRYQRSYHAPLPLPDVIAQIQREAGTHFDPALVPLLVVAAEDLDAQSALSQAPSDRPAAPEGPRV